MIRGIHHLAVSTIDLERAVAFYRDLLGFELVTRFSWPKGSPAADRLLDLPDSAAQAALLSAGNAMIELFQFESPTPKPGDPNRPVCDHGLAHLCILVSDLDEEYERLKTAGMKFHCPPQQDRTMKVTYGRDPDGNVVELLEILSSRNPFSLKPRSQVINDRAPD